MTAHPTGSAATATATVTALPLAHPATAPTSEAATANRADAVLPLLHWTQGGQAHSALWRSERGAPPPKRVVLADDTLSADAAYRLACEGTGLLWCGDYHQARQLLQAMARRLDRAARPRPAAPANGRSKPTVKPPSNSQKPRENKEQTVEFNQATEACFDGGNLSKNSSTSPAPAAAMGTETVHATDPAQAFHRHRQAQAHRARVLGMVLLPVAADHTIPLRRAPHAAQACADGWGAATASTPASVVSLRELLALISAHEWQKKGVEIPALGPPPHNRIHPRYGVFSPVRGEYLDLVAKAPLPAPAAQLRAFDIGTGTGVLSAVLARRGVAHVVATDLDPRALACARANLHRLGVAGTVDVVPANLFPPGQAQLVVCNPPWLPARPSSPIEHAVYDEGSRMLRGFLAGLAAHLAPGGEGWLILSNLAEHLGLRAPTDLADWIAAAGLRVVGRLDARPQHPKATDATDPLHAARAAEVTTLWRLAAQVPTAPTARAWPAHPCQPPAERPTPSMQRVQRGPRCAVPPGAWAWLCRGMLWAGMLAIAPATAATASTATTPSTAAVNAPTRLRCEVVYQPTQASWVREVVLAHSGKRLHTVSIDGVAVHAFALSGSVVLTALDNERIQLDLSQPAWRSDFRGLATGQGLCALQP